MIKTRTLAPLLLLLLLISLTATAQRPRYDAIYSGVPWFDNQGKEVSAHGAGVVKDKGRYYLFGEKHADNTNEFAGFTCYSSSDLANWKFESIALPVQASGKLGPKRVGERPKVLKCPKTGEYIMYMHVDTMGYNNQFIGYATASKVTGPYTFKGPLLFNGQPVTYWDMGTFQDRDGAGYVLIHGGNIYKLNDDYRSVSAQVLKNMTSGFESPALFRKGSLYYLLGSNLTGWERNDNYYFTATSLAGPWTNRGLFCPEGTITWNSQTTFVLPVEGAKDTTYIFMGDRWSFPYQASAATYVWQPLTVSGTRLSIPTFLPAWKINTSTGVAAPATIAGKIIESSDEKALTYSGQWQPDTLGSRSADAKGDCYAVQTTGRQIGLYALSRATGGYARVILQNSKAQTVLSTVVDMYSKYPVPSLKFLSPMLPKDKYTLSVCVMGEHWRWVEKSGRVTSSKGKAVFLDKIVVVD